MKEFYIDCDGIPLHAKLDSAPGGDDAPLCILIHGFTGDMEEEHILAARDVMNEVGVSVLRVEMYGHGKSGGDFRDHTLYKWVANALSVLEYVKSMDHVTDIYISGHSQGGLLAMLIAGMCPDDISMLIPLSPAWMIPKMARKGEILGIEFDPAHIPEEFHSEEWDITSLSGNYVRVAQTIHVEDEIARYKGPVLIIHGEADETVPISYAVKACELYHNAKLIRIPGAAHSFEDHIKEMADALRNDLLQK